MSLESWRDGGEAKEGEAKENMRWSDGPKEIGKEVEDAFVLNRHVCTLHASISKDDHSCTHPSVVYMLLSITFRPCRSPNTKAKKKEKKERSMPTKRYEENMP